MSQSTRLSLAGFFATAVAFGPGRMGYGLFLPEFRDAFALSTEASGFIASAAFAVFLFALLLASLLTANFGPRAPVVAGGVLAFFGMALVAISPNVAVLAFGIALAAASAGFSWTPYNTAAERVGPEHLRGRVLSVVSTGTTLGIAAAGLLALTMALYGLSWRWTWGAFAAVGFGAAAVNASVLRSTPRAAGQVIRRRQSEPMRLRSLARAEALPLFAASLSFGLTNAIYLSFAVDNIERAGGQDSVPAEALGPILFMAYGTAGAIGLFTEDIKERLGVARLRRVIFVCSFFSLALLGMAPGNLPAVVMSAALQGGCVMTISAMFAFRSLRLFPNLPSVSFTAVLVVLAVGNVVGPALAGLAASQFGLKATFVAAGSLSLMTALMLPRQAKRETPNAS